MNRSTSRYILIAGILCTMLGIGVIVGWHFRVAATTRIAADDAVMTFNAGIAFLCSGLGSIAVGLGSRWVWPARICAGLASAIGLITLTEHLFHLKAGIDQVFFVDHLSQGTYPGRMAYISAICFLISGIALIIIVWGKPDSRRPFVSAALGAAVFALGLSSMAQHFLGIRPVSIGSSIIDMAINTSVGFIALGVGIVHESWHIWAPESAEPFEVGGFLPPFLMRPWAPFAMTCIAAGLSIFVWRALVVKQDTEITRANELQAARTESDISLKIAARGSALAGFSHQWDIYGDLTHSQWNAECQQIERNLPGWQSISLVDIDGRTQWTTGHTTAGLPANYNYFHDALSRRAFEATRRTGSVTGTHQIKTPSGQHIFLLVDEVMSHGELNGYLVGVFRSDLLFPTILDAESTRGFAISVDDAGIHQKPFWGRASLPDADATPTDEPYDIASLVQWEQTFKVSECGLGWNVHIRPTAKLIEQQQSSIPGLMLGLGLLFAGMVGATVYFARTARVHSLHAVGVNRTLEKEIGERLEYMRQVEIERENALKGWAEAERQAALIKNQAQELKRSNDALTEFASIASHDLKEPLRKIQTFGDMLRRRSAHSLDNDGVGYLERMTGAASRMQLLIEGLLAYSRVSTRPPDLVRVDLNELVRGVCGDLEARIADGGGRVDCGELPVLQADPVQMRQLFQNLIGNALKFRRTDVSPIVTLRGERDRNGIARITISDNGIGFEPKFADRIFRIFERLEAPSRFEGTGIGLAICRSIIERHHGTIVASAAPDKGATFTVEIPCDLVTANGRSES